MSRPDPAAATPVSGWVDTEVSVRLRRGVGDTVRVDGVLHQAPVWFRWDGATLWLVGSGASPVGEDHIRVRVELGPGVTAAVRSVAATMVYAARGNGTRWDTTIHVAADAVLDWRPEPVILTARARHRSTTTLHASTGAEVTLDEVLVLGRAGEDTGSLVSTLAVDIDGAPVLLTSVDTALPGWSGPGGVGGASVVANRLRLGGAVADGGVDRTGERAVETSVGGVAVLHPAPGCRLAVATADDVTDARDAIAGFLPG